MKRCGNIVKSCRNNVKDKNHVFNWNKTNVFNLVRSIISIMSLKKKKNGDGFEDKKTEKLKQHI